MSNTLAEIRKTVADCLARLDKLMDLAIVQDLVPDELEVAVRALLDSGIWSDKNKATYDNAGNKNKMLKAMLSDKGEEVITAAIAEHRKHAGDGALVEEKPKPKRKPGRPRKDAAAE